MSNYAKFTISLNESYTKDISVDWATKDGTAKAGIDYTSSSGTVIIPSGKTSIDIYVDILLSSPPSEDIYFSVYLSNPINGQLNRISGNCTIDKYKPVISVSKERSLSMAQGHHNFLQLNTGETMDGSIQHYIINTESVLSNNRQYLGATRQETQPNGDGTTEGQSLLIIGYVLMYNATQNPQWLEFAEKYWQSYFDNFYGGVELPTTPQPMYSNWIINSKEPVLSHYPIASDFPTHGGYKSVPLTFVNGLATIPHGDPFYGEYLDVISFAHRGYPCWNAINATMQKIKEDESGLIDWSKIPNNIIYKPENPSAASPWVDWNAILNTKIGITPDWKNDASVYNIDWMVAWTGQKLDGNGNILEEKQSNIGQIQLLDKTINGVYFVNYASRVPVENGGYMLPRNKAWHNRPVNVPVNLDSMSNSSDSEQWFGDACYLLWKATNNTKYQIMYESVQKVCLLYADIDRSDRFFRQSTVASDPWTDGIAYDYAYPSTVERNYKRDSNGYIVLDTTDSVRVTMEQQAIWFKVSQQSILSITVGGSSKTSGEFLSVIPKLTLSNTNATSDSSAVIYQMPLPLINSNSPTTYNYPLSKMVRVSDPNGNDYLTASMKQSVPYGTATSTLVYDDNVLGTRAGNIVQLVTDGNSGLVVDFSYLDYKPKLLSFTYKSGVDNFNLRIEDDNKWRWWWMLPATNGSWKTITLDITDAKLSGYQPDHSSSEQDPSSPVFSTISSLTLITDTDPVASTATLSYYCINDVPPLYTLSNQFTALFDLIIESSDSNSGWNLILGNCTILDYLLNSLDYTPGTIPFSNNLNQDSQLFDSWHGVPFPGYQYPFTWIDNSEYLNNMIDFLYDSQQAYNKKFGILGPVASGYIWNRWDNLSYGEPNTWIFTEWGDDPWAGYFARAFFGACRAYYELNSRNSSIPDKLISYINNWISFLYTFQNDNNGMNPTEFPSNSVPTTSESDFTPHMTGLWLSGCCYMLLSGMNNIQLETIVNNSISELSKFYTNLPNFIMDSSWSTNIVDLDINSSLNNSSAYGFHSGEILRGIALYLMYLNSIGE